MKKLIAVFLVGIFAVFAASCATGAGDASSGSGQSAAQKNPGGEVLQQQNLISVPEVTLTAADIQQIYNRKTAQAEMKLIKLGWFYKQTFFEAAGAGDTEKNATQYYVFDAEKQRINYAGEHKNVEIGLGESVIMQGRYLFGWAPVHDGAATRNQLVRVDAQTYQTRVVQERSDVGEVAIHLSKLNENEFIGVVPKQAGGTAAICVEKYNGQTGAYQEIIGPDAAKNGDCTLGTACAVDGKVYALGWQQAQGVLQYYLLTYDANGTFLKKTKTSGMESLFNGEEFGHMYVAGNVLAVTSYSGTRYMLYYNTGESYQPVLKETQQVICAGNMANFWDSKSLPYLFFTDYQPSQGIQSDQISLYAIRTADGRIYRIQLAVNGDLPPLGKVLMDEAGNIAVTYFNEVDHVAYWISAETLNKKIR